MLTQGIVVLTNFDSIYHSLDDLETVVRAFADIAEDWCEEDLKHALVKLLSENLNQKLQMHQQAVYRLLTSVEQSQSA